MLTIIFQFVIGLLLLVGGAEVLLRGAVSLARRFGISPLAIGLTVVAYGTSTPELVVSLQAALADSSQIAVGNVVGSNIFNIAFILGASALVCPLVVKASLVRMDAPIMIGVSALGVALLWDGAFTRTEGLVFVVGLAAFTWFVLWYGRRTTLSDSQPEVPSEQNRPLGLPLAIGATLLGLGVLVVGSRLLLLGSVALAQRLGVSEAIIGLTIVAAGTSLPELATSVLAGIRRQPDIAVGNIVGSNIFNLLGILGITATLSPIEASGMRPTDLWLMLGLALVLWPMILTGRRLHRIEGLLLLLAYCGYLAWSWPK